MSFEMTPIGYMRSVFHQKNGTPRQSSLVESARGILTIEKSVFTNPDHSLDGLEEYSHAWILFVFHKNNNPHFKAKVKPPRLNGHRVGVFSSRSPYRPNNIGLSLVKIDRIEGSSVHVSGIDILDGTPVIDIKPYIPDYDAPKILSSKESEQQFMHEMDFTISESESTTSKSDEIRNKIDKEKSPKNSGEKVKDFHSKQAQEISEGFYSMSSALEQAERKLKSSKISDIDDVATQDSLCLVSSQFQGASENSRICSFSLNDANCKRSLGKSDLLQTENHVVNKINNSTNEMLQSVDSCQSHNEKSLEVKENLKTNSKDNERELAVVAHWLINPPTPQLSVSFTTEAMQQLNLFSPEPEDIRYRLNMIKNTEEAKQSISDVLREDPRSVYRKSNCADSLYYFAIDNIHVTCWFDTNSSAQVIRIQPTVLAPKLQNNCLKQ